MRQSHNRGFVEQRYLTVFFGIFLLSILLFAGSRALPLLSGPRIVLDTGSPRIKDRGTVQVSGKVYRSTTFTIDNSVVIPDENGTFVKELFLTSGHTIMTLTAADRFGRRVHITIPIYIPNYGTQKNNEESSGRKNGDQGEKK